MIWTWGGISHYISSVTPDPVLKHPCPITSEACIPGSRRGESEKLILLKYWCFTPAQPVPEGRGFDSSLCSVFMICLHHLAGIYAVCCPQQVVVVAFYYCVHISKQIDLGCSAGFCSVIKLQAHEQFEEPKLEAVRENNVELVQDILKELSPIAQSSQAANELVRILKEPHFQVRAYCGSQASVWCLVNVTLSINDAYWAYTHCKHGLCWSPADRPALQWPQQPDLSIASHVKYSNVETISYRRLHYHLFFFFYLQSLLETHDSVASKNYETPPPSPCSFMDAALNNQPVPPDAVRMVGIRKVSGEHLVSLHNKWFGLYFFTSFSSSERAGGAGLMIKGWFKCSNCWKVWELYSQTCTHSLSTLTFTFEPNVCVQGVTFRVENGELVIARILHGGMIDQQGLLHVGDIIKEVNGKEVGNDPKVLQEMLKEASGSVVLKILPSYQEPHTARQVSENRHKVCVTFL